MRIFCLGCSLLEVFRAGSEDRQMDLTGEKAGTHRSWTHNAALLSGVPVAFDLSGMCVLAEAGALLHGPKTHLAQESENLKGV